MASRPSWSFTAPSDSSSASTVAAVASSAPAHFSSSFGAFGLPQPRASPSNLSLQLESRGVGFGADGGAQAGGTLAGGPGQPQGAMQPTMTPTPGATGLMVPPAGWESKMGQPQPSPSSSANGHARRGSLLANDAMNWDDDAEPAWPSTPNTSQHFGDGARPSSAGGSGPGNAASAVDEGMSMSPMGAPSALSQHMGVHGPPSSSSSTATSAAYPRQVRSRSGSASNAMVVNPAVPTALPSSLYPSFPAVPPSPVTIARALQVGQKTPPPFLARRLFKDGDSSMQEESNSASGRSSRSGSSSDTTAPSAISAGAGSTGTSSGGVYAPRPRMTRATTTMAATHTPDEDEEIEELSAVLSRSASAGPEDPFERVVRRPVSRKPNLLVRSCPAVSALSSSALQTDRPARLLRSPRPSLTCAC